MSGWKRLGVIASIAWILGAGLHTASVRSNEAVQYGSRLTLSCEGIDSPTGPHASDACDKLGMDFTLNYPIWTPATIVAFVPVPFGWAAVYLGLFLVK